MRQRHVYPTAQVIHIWAHQSQDSARNGSNVSFDGKLLYSHTTVIAQLETDTGGNTWAFLSSEGLTPRTAKHVSASRYATRHINRFYTPAFTRWRSYRRTIAEMIQPAIDEAERNLKGAFGPRRRQATKLSAMQVYNARRDEIFKVCQAFGLDLPDLPAVNVEEIAQYAAQVAEQVAEQEKAAQARRAEAARLQRIEDQDRYNLWLMTGAGRFPSSFRVYGQDQITIKGDVVVTSQGAECPLDHAIRALRFWQSRQYYVNDVKMAQGLIHFAPYHTNGHKIPLGHFELTSIADTGEVRAGCHTINRGEIERFISQFKRVLGL